MPDAENLPTTNLGLTLLAIVGAAVVAFVLGSVISAIVRRTGRGNHFIADLSRRIKRPLRAVLVVVAVWIALGVITDSELGWWGVAQHLLLIALIIVCAWFVGALAFVIEDSALKRFRTDIPDNRHARRIRTQITVIRRLTVAIIVMCAIAGVLLTFPSAQAAGTSIFASAGVISLVAGLAAQSSLGNVFAGLQIAFTDAIRVDDVVVLEGEWGRIEEITMTYVVVHLWDDRRLIIPCMYFTSTVFQNWTRRAADLLGTVEIDLDWEVPMRPMRAELQRLLEATTLWDKRVGILQVTDAVGGFVRVRALASAVDAGTLFDLRCYIREGLVDWLQAQAPQGLPRTRLAQSEEGAALVEAVLGAAAGNGTGASRSKGQGKATSAGKGGAKVTDEPHLPKRVPVRVARPGVRMHLSEPARGLYPSESPVVDEREAEETVVLPATEGGLFTGSRAAMERSKAFSGPGKDVIDERERTAVMQKVTDEDEESSPMRPAESSDEG
ncbi:mechanosensitive ion channel family protein [Sanguibacter antarcticus]|uniref:Small-conductance mechanosensitive channel n=1 Tax=Sanguibacter antarcticus TaxID=372484 RepID=A0A2A9E8D6_9MICO|nr:mechanosensitive ion channel family protein [Sanguibacter antarcticus]PFG35124.1 small-conductance mechanosensitive channel [Sanguibacter antarcticus]